MYTLIGQDAWYQQMINQKVVFYKYRNCSMKPSGGLIYFKPIWGWGEGGGGLIERGRGVII